MTVHVEVGLIDPLNKIKSAALHYLAAKCGQGQAQADRSAGIAAALPQVAVEDGKAIGHGRVHPEKRRHRGVAVVPGGLRQRRREKRADQAAWRKPSRRRRRRRRQPPAGPARSSTAAAASESSSRRGSWAASSIRSSAMRRRKRACSSASRSDWARGPIDDVISAIRPIFLTAAGRRGPGQAARDRHQPAGPRQGQEGLRRSWHHGKIGGLSWTDFL